MEELKSARDYLIYAHNCLIKVIHNSYEVEKLQEVKELQDKTSNLIDSLDNVIKYFNYSEDQKTNEEKKYQSY